MEDLNALTVKPLIPLQVDSAKSQQRRRSTDPSVLPQCDQAMHLLPATVGPVEVRQPHEDPW